MKLLDQGIEPIRPRNVDTPPYALIPALMHRDNNSMHGLPRTMPVITHQVSCVGRCLVNICLRRLFLSLQLKDNNRSPYEEDDVGTTGL